MAANTKQKSTLPKEVADAKPWVGLHISQLYQQNKPLSFLAEKWIEGQEDENVRRVFVNKRMGDVYAYSAQETTVEQWRGLIYRDEGPDAYALGEVPPQVSFLTAGQDSRATQLHWAVWGWGIVRDVSDYPLLCGWLVDYGVVERTKSLTLDAADLRVFDDLVYNRGFPQGEQTLYVRHGYHDQGWQPVAVWEYCRERAGRAVPAFGDALDEVQALRRPVHRWGNPPKYRLHGVDVTPNIRPAQLNTFLLKVQLFGLVGKTYQTADGPRNRLTLPPGVKEPYLMESSSEHLTTRKGKRVWSARGANHWSDCNVQAFAAALNLNPFQGGLTRGERQAAAQSRAENARRKRLAEGRDNGGGFSASAQQAGARRRAASRPRRGRGVRRRY
jgi:phage terminase large subunit GpA-like protein